MLLWMAVLAVGMGGRGGERGVGWDRALDGNGIGKNLEIAVYAFGDRGIGYTFIIGITTTWKRATKSCCCAHDGFQLPLSRREIAF